MQTAFVSTWYYYYAKLQYYIDAADYYRQNSVVCRSAM